MQKLIFLRSSYFTIILLILIHTSCKPSLSEADLPNAGQGDFSRYVAIGNSLTAGMVNNGITNYSQSNSFPSLLAKQFQLVGQSSFQNPVMEGNGSGDLSLQSFTLQCEGTDPIPTIVSVLEDPNWIQNISSSGPFNNLGIPRMKVADLNRTDWAADPLNNIDSLSKVGPYLGRISASQSTSYHDLVIDQLNIINPSFYTIALGIDDAMLFAATGGGYLSSDYIGPYICDVPLPNIALTSKNDFKNHMENFIADCLGAMDSTAQGFVFNIPNVLDLPYFQALHNSFLANQYEAIRPDLVTYDTLEYRLPSVCDSFVPIWIRTNSGVRLAKETDRILLPAAKTLGLDLMLDCDAVPAGLLHGLSEQDPLLNSEVLDSIELAKISDYITNYNNTISDLSEEYGFQVFDAAGVMGRLNGGYNYQGADYNGRYIQGGVFGLDGIHPTTRGYVLFTNELLRTINATFGSSLPLLDPMLYKGIEFP